MNPTVTAILVAVPPLLIALTAWLRAEVANRRVKGKQDRPNNSRVSVTGGCGDQSCHFCGDA